MRVRQEEPEGMELGCEDNDLPSRLEATTPPTVIRIWEANLDVMAADARRQRGDRPFVFTNLRTGEGVQQVVDFIREQGLLDHQTKEFA